MAFTSFIAGDHFNHGDNVYTKVPKSGYTPAIGHLVVLDASIANGVDLIAANEAIYGIVVAFGTWSASNTGGTISVAKFTPGSRIVLPTTGVIAKGDKVEYGGTALSTGVVPRTVVQADNTNGNGFVVAAGAGESPAGADTAVVEFT